MKRYWLFEWVQHGDEPPLYGFSSDYDSLQEAMDAGDRIITDMVTVLDVSTGNAWQNHICKLHTPKWESIGHISKLRVV